MQILTLNSIDALRAHADAWDDLWRRSAVTIPTVQAELIAQWYQAFGEGATFRAVVVEDAGRFVAALPLMGKRLGALMKCGITTANEWTPASELLLDESADVPAVLDLLLKGLTQLPWALLWFEVCLAEQPRWVELQAACERAGLGCDVQERFRIAKTAITGDFAAYRATWSRNHRRNMTRYRRKLEDEHGQVSLRWLQPTSRCDLGALLRRGFEIEDRSWKGAAGTSVLRTPGKFAFFVQQAEALAARRQLGLAFLDVAGQPIAFEYGWLAKQTYHPFKIGYDERYHEYGPGQLLVHDLLERFFAEEDVQAMDYVGPVSAATSKWETSEYSVARMVIAPRRLTSRALMYAYQHVWPTLRRWREAPRTQSPTVALAAVEDVREEAETSLR